MSEWLQNVAPLARDLYGAIDIHRRSLWLVDPAHRTYRQLAIPPQWAMQELALWSSD